MGGHGVVVTAFACDTEGTRFEPGRELVLLSLIFGLFYYNLSNICILIFCEKSVNNKIDLQKRGSIYI